MKLIFVRHGRPQLPAGEKRYIGQTDYPLSAEGKKQIRETGRRLFQEFPSVSRIYSSPLERCRESGEILANLLHCPVLYSDDLKEIHMGSWENIPIKHIKEKNPTAYALRGAHMADYICPGGESFSMVQKRALKALSETVSHASKEDTLLFVTHAGVIRSLLCFYENQPLENLFQYKIGYGEAVILPSSLFCY